MPNFINEKARRIFYKLPKWKQQEVIEAYKKDTEKLLKRLERELRTDRTEEYRESLEPYQVTD